MLNYTSSKHAKENRLTVDKPDSVVCLVVNHLKSLVVLKATEHNGLAKQMKAIPMFSRDVIVTS